MGRNDRRDTRQISYAFSASSRSGRAMIRLMENSTGRLRLIRRAEGYEHEIGAGRSFFDVMADRYGLSLDIVGGTLDRVPADGPVIFIANHPYGILDGLMLGHIMGRTRDDFRVIAHSVFNRAPDLGRHLLPISFDSGREARVLNLETRARAVDFLSNSGAVGIFPGGTVSTASRPFARPMDPVWRSFTARMIARSRAQVVPVYFDGHTSRLFQIASHLNFTLRMGLLIKEFRDRVDAPVRVSIGAPIGREILDPLAGEAKAMMDFLRKATYGLSPEPLVTNELGFEFEASYRA